jgi:predicted amidohydrolase YtcJ
MTRLLSSILVLVVLTSACEQQKTLDLLVKNGIIYTMDEKMPKAKVVGVIDGKIAFVGDVLSSKYRVDEYTKVLDLQGKTMTPGWIEGHGHFMGMGYNKLQLDLMNTNNYQQVVDLVAAAVKESKPGQWIIGRGWHQSKWEPQPDTLVKGFPTHYKLSAVSPDNPVYLRHASGHAAFANAKAMEIAGIKNIQIEDAPIAVGEGGEVIRDELGNPTGVFNETAMGVISRHVPESTPELDRKALKLAIEECLSFGVTSFQDAGASQGTIDKYRKAVDDGTMSIRMWAMLRGDDESLLSRWFESGPEIGYGNDHLTIRSVKMYMDGALGSQGAWLLQEYNDRPEHFGHSTTPIDSLLSVSERALVNGFQVCSHAIGDRANREVLDRYQQVFEMYPERAKNARFRIEHAQHISAQDQPRFAELGVIASMQAIHLSSDRPWAIHRLGMERIVEGAYVWQKLLQSGAIVINGSDVPVEPLNPLASFYASITRKTLNGEPEGGYEPDQRMTREQALRSYTLDAAFGAFEEDQKGSIEAGKLADFAVFSKDIMQVPENEILETRVLYTIVGGVIYAQNS